MQNIIAFTRDVFRLLKLSEQLPTDDNNYNDKETSNSQETTPTYV